MDQINFGNARVDRARELRRSNAIAAMDELVAEAAESVSQFRAARGALLASPRGGVNLVQPSRAFW